MPRPKQRFVTVNALPGTVPHKDSSLFFPSLKASSGWDESPTTTQHHIDTDMVYFKNGKPRPFDPWKREGDSATGGCGPARNIKRYKDSSGTTHKIYGTVRRLYDGTVNITPLEGSPTTIANSLDTVASSAVVTVNATGHGMEVGDRVEIDNAADVGGITAATYLNKEHIVTGVPSANEFEITVGTTASSTVNAGGGASTTYDTQIMLADEFSGGVYTPNIWSFAVLNKTLYVSPGRQGKIYVYANSTDTAPTVQSGAPSSIDWLGRVGNALVALDGNVFNASAQRDASNWTAGPASTAYQETIASADDFISLQEGRSGQFLLFTKTQVYIGRYTGDIENLYSIDILRSSDGIAGARAVCEIDGVIFWFGLRNGYRFDGSSVEPLQGFTCRDNVFGNLALYEGDGMPLYSFVMPYPERGQVIWWWGWDEESLNDFTDGVYMGDYVIYDYEEGHATTGRLPRSAAENEIFNATVLMAGPDYSSGYVDDSFKVFEHGADNAFTGSYYDIAPAKKVVQWRTPWAMAGEGDSDIEIKSVAPDVQFLGNTANAPAFTVDVFTQDYAMTASPSSAATLTVGFGNSAKRKEDTGVQTLMRSYLYKADYSAIADISFNIFRIGNFQEQLQEGTPAT